MAKNRHYKGPDGSNRALYMRKAWEMAPKLIAAFALVLYENTDMDPEQIEDLCAQVAPLYNRAQDEGWDIRENCYKLTGVNVYHEQEAKALGIGTGDEEENDGK